MSYSQSGTKVHCEQPQVSHSSAAFPYFSEDHTLPHSPCLLHSCAPCHPTQTGRNKSRVESTFAIIGAGMGGMAMAITLKRQLGSIDFVMFEQSSTVGGTWRDTQYPGCSSDVPMPWYGFATHHGFDWERPYALHNDIHAYLVDVAEQETLSHYCMFNTVVKAAKWDQSSHLWRLVVENCVTHETMPFVARFLVSAVGARFDVVFPDVPGLDEFRGPVFHSARWRHDVDLRGKRVAVIGNGTSAAQLVPKISEDSSIQVVNFARTPVWFVPPLSNANYSATIRWLRRSSVVFACMHRFVIFLMFEMRFVAWTKDTLLSKILTAALTSYMKNNAPLRYHGQMVPKLAPGCKRLVIDNGYLSALNRPNVELSFDHIQNITHDGIITSDGEHAIDVIVCATGYDGDNFSVPVVGRAGQTVSEYWTSQQGPTAYLGTMLPGFPNFFMMTGPNSASGHNSATFMQEAQASFILRIVEPILDGTLDCIEPTIQATEKFNARLESGLSRLVFTRCTSWYRSGRLRDGKVSAMWPGPTSSFWWATRRPTWSDYEVSETKEGLWEKRLALAVAGDMVFETVIVVTILGLLCAWYMYVRI